MGCGCGGSKYVAPVERAAAQRHEVIVTDPNDPANFWNGPEPRQEPIVVPASK